MYVIMKLGYEAPIYDKLGFGANFKRRIKSVVQINQSTNEVQCSFRQVAMEYKMGMRFILFSNPGTQGVW